MADHDPALSRLLSGRRTLSRPEKETIFDAVWSGVRHEEASQTQGAGRSWWGIVLAFAVAAGLVASVGLFPPPPQTAALGVRGTGQGPLLTLLCDGRPERGSCAVGHELSFEIAGFAPFTHLALFAQQADSTIWYLPRTETDHSAPLEVGVETSLVPQVVELGAEHAPGPWEVTAMFSRHPLSREDVRRRFLAPTPGEDVRIVQRRLMVR